MSRLEQCRDSLDNLPLKLTNRQCRIFLCKQRGVNCRRLQKLFKSRLIVRRPPIHSHTTHTGDVPRWMIAQQQQQPHRDANAQNTPQSVISLDLEK